MGCCSATEEQTWPRKDGRGVSRTCTDKFCMVLFWAFVAGMVVTIGCGLKWGNPKRLTHGTNWKGELCGIDAAVVDAKFMMFCGSPERTGNPAFPKYINAGSTACVAACPTDGSTPISCLMPAYHNFTSYQGGMIGNIPNSETLQVTLTQSVTKQDSYPTEEWGGRFCLPSSANPALRDMIINGPWGRAYRPTLAVGGLMDAWPLFLGTIVLALLLGYLYLFALSRCAGFLIYITMLIATALSLAAGLFFFWAMFIDMDDTTTVYAKFNPIMSVYIGSEAKVYSILVGIVIIVVGVISGILTMTSLTHIDEMVGLIEAACTAVNQICALWIFVLFQTAALLLLLWFFILFGFPYVASLGSYQSSQISVNGVPLEGLLHVWKKSFWDNVMYWYYIVGIFFLIELFIQFGHFMIAYIVSKWYFSGGEISTVDNNRVIDKAIGKGIGKKQEVRVAGVDTNYGLRQGTVVETSAGKVLVVPVGKKGPGLGRNDMTNEEFVKESVGFFPSLGYLASSSLNALLFHTGSLALGAPIIFIFRPFRMIAQCVAGFLTKTGDKDRGPSYSDDAHNASLKGCLTLMSACLEQVFGKYSKNAFTELVLNGQDGFLDCSEAAFRFLVQSGGSIAHLHGAMLLYELFGTLCITLVCGWGVWIVQEKVDVFNEKASSFYIEDKSASLIASMLIAFMIGTCWMSMWNQTADVLLYCVAWNRRQVHLGEEHSLPENEMLGEVKEYCPQTLRYLLPPHEMEAAAEHGLHAHGIGQQGAILAAMDHGNTMSMGGGGGSTKGPQYSQMVAGVHETAGKFLG